MKRNGFIIVILILLSFSLKAQIFKIENGISVSSLHAKAVSFDKMIPYQVGLGLDYYDNGWFNLSSQIGFIKKGSKEKIPVYTDTSVFPNPSGEYIFQMNANYFTLNTTFKIKKEVRKEIYYVGTGPRIDFKIKDNNKGWELEEMRSRKVLYGLKLETGVDYNLNNNLLFGLNFAYLPSFNKQIDYLMDRTFTVGFVIGYKLN